MFYKDLFGKLSYFMGGLVSPAIAILWAFTGSGFGWTISIMAISGIMVMINGRLER